MEKMRERKLPPELLPKTRKKIDPIFKY